MCVYEAVSVIAWRIQGPTATMNNDKGGRGEGGRRKGGEGGRGEGREGGGEGGREGGGREAWASLVAPADRSTLSGLCLVSVWPRNIPFSLLHTHTSCQLVNGSSAV